VTAREQRVILSPFRLESQDLLWPFGRVARRWRAPCFWGNRGDGFLAKANTGLHDVVIGETYGVGCLTTE
jgi:hypothetical protein